MPHVDFEIEGDRAVVTAAGRGIGREIAAGLAAAGVNVVINDIDSAAAEAAASDLADLAGRVVPVPGDVSDVEASSRLVETAVDTFGGLDILVNNVGIAGPRKPCEEISGEAFMDTLSVNLGGIFNPTREAIPHLKRSPAGRIVNVSSKSAKHPRTNRTPYAASKMGVIGFTRTLALELAEHGVTANTVCPGTVAGDRLDRVITRRADRLDLPVDEVEREFRESSPMDVLTKPNDVADMVLFLCSTRADHVVGQDLNVSAGRIMV